MEKKTPNQLNIMDHSKMRYSYKGQVNTEENSVVPFCTRAHDTVGTLISYRHRLRP